MNLAGELELPVVLHCRNANEELFSIPESKYRSHIKNYGVLWHCFSGNTEDAVRATSLGIKLAFGGTITYPNNDRNRLSIGWLRGERHVGIAGIGREVRTAE